MSGKKKNVISKASPHTIKKFELIEEYIKSWAQKLLLNDSCNGLIFIDCMCNSGIYTDDDGNPVKGTALRVSEALREAARTYTEKNIHIYLNDKDKARVDELEKHLPKTSGISRSLRRVEMRMSYFVLSGHSCMEPGICIISCSMIRMMRLSIGRRFCHSSATGEKS